MRVVIALLGLSHESAGEPTKSGKRTNKSPTETDDSSLEKAPNRCTDDLSIAIGMLYPPSAMNVLHSHSVRTEYVETWQNL